jgi:hypothetical protein
MKASIFIGDAVHEREITLADGSKEVFLFRELKNIVFEHFAIQSNSADEDVVALASAKLLAAGLCERNDKGDIVDALNVEQATRIRRPIFRKLLAALMEVNGYGKDRKAVEDQAKKP